MIEALTKVGAKSVDSTTQKKMGILYYLVTRFDEQILADSSRLSYRQPQTRCLVCLPCLCFCVFLAALNRSVCLCVVHISILHIYVLCISLYVLPMHAIISMYDANTRHTNTRHANTRLACPHVAARLRSNTRYARSYQYPWVGSPPSPNTRHTNTRHANTRHANTRNSTLREFSRHDYACSTVCMYTCMYKHFSFFFCKGAPR